MFNRKLPHTLTVTLVLWFANQAVDSKITCPKDQYIVVKNGNESCLQCGSCPHGLGLYPPCGSTINHPPPIDCVPCVAGKTYSDDYGPSSCKPCQICSTGEIVTRNCTESENAICSETCEEGYYYENSTYGCHKCSYCCNNDDDIRIKECESMPSNKQCSAHSCKPEPPTKAHVVTASPSSSATGTASTGAPNNSSDELNIVFGCLGAVFAVILFIGLILLYKRRKKKRNKNLNVYAYNQRGEVEDGRRLLQDDDCDLNHMLLNVTTESPNPVTDGQKISLSVSLDMNQNGNIKDDTGHRKCILNYEWKKDGDNIPKNNNQNYSKDLTINEVEVADSGRYYCEIHCSEHQNHKENSCAIEIHVQPGEGNELKLFSELGHTVEQKVANLLTPEIKGTGNWMELGREYGMQEDVLKALVEKDKAAVQVLEYIKSVFPELTVFDFCKVLKSDKMKQKKIVKLLKDDLTKPKKTAAKPDFNASNRPDSGISEEFDSDHLPPSDDVPDVKVVDSSKPSQLKVPALLNLSYADSSREASRESSLEDLPGSFYDNVKSSKPVDQKGNPKGLKSRFLRRKQSGDNSQNGENNDSNDEDEDQKPETAKKTRYGRQTSKDSQKSDIDDVGVTRERKRSRSSSITNSLKGLVLKQPSVEYSSLEHHHEESD